jgi:hypothetical protein
LEKENIVMSDQMSPEEQRREMRRRFDAKNKTADDSRGIRRDADAVRQNEANKRKLTPGAPEETSPGESTGQAPAD